MKAKTFRIVAFSCAALLLALIIVLSSVVGAFSASLAFFFGKSQVGTATRASGEALATRIEEEGIVMVKNADNVLPLSKDDVTKDGEQRLNVFGWASTDWIMGGSGSGRAINIDKKYTNDDLKPETDLFRALDTYTVFSDDGIKHNATLTKLYTDYKSGGRDAAARDTLHYYDYESCVLYEPTISAYTDELKSNFESYSDVAIVVLGRISGESNDAPKAQYKYKGTTDTERTYLDISTEEEDMLTYVGSKFDKVVVLINSTNQMNLEFMNRIPGLDACLIVGATGNNAANAIPNVLFGQKKVAKTDSNGEEVKDAAGNVEYDIVQVSPSGRTVDTYAYDFKTNPNWFYSGKDGVTVYGGTLNNSNLYPVGVKNANVGSGASGENYDAVRYLDYVEGVYVGYKWYETADAEGYWDDVSNTYGKGYDGVVQYPFGRGLSYTTFDWEINNWKNENGKISVTVDVTNIGDYAGQEVVQMYYTPEYTGKLEKAAVNLAAFAKTEVLQPQSVDPDNCSQRLTLSFDVQDMASYDQDNGDGAYVLEKGDYTVTLRTDAHNVANYSGATHKFSFNEEVYNNYANDPDKKLAEIKNLFLDESSDGVAVDGSDSNQTINWLSRKNHFENFPKAKAEARQWQDALVATNKYTNATATAWDAAWKDENGAVNYVQNQANGYKLANTKTNGDGVQKLDYANDRSEAFTDDVYFFGNPKNFDDDKWEALLNQMSDTELSDLALHGYIHEQEIKSIGKPATRSLDGPAQVGSFNANAYAQIGYPNPTTLAQTWSAELAKSFGMAAATQALGAGVDGWYAPGVNLHRSAFGGRNYEYYSEDPFLSGIMCSNTVRGALNLGVYTYIKHLIGYDQESYRDSLYCWMTEQALRENYLRPFKIAIDNGASGLMTSYGRLGAVWSGGSRALLTDLLRDEWGYKGAVLTDYSDHQDFMNGDQMLRAGGDMWMDGYADSAIKGSGGPGKWVYGSTTSDAYKYHIRLAAKHTIYMWANAAYEAKAYIDNGGDKIEIEKAGPKVFAWWWLIVAIVDVGCAAGAGVLIYLGIKKKDKPVAEAVTEAPVDSSEPSSPVDTNDEPNTPNE